MEHLKPAPQHEASIIETYAAQMPDDIWLQIANDDGEMLVGIDRTWASMPLYRADVHYVREFNRREARERYVAMSWSLERVRAGADWWRKWSGPNTDNTKDLMWAANMLEQAEKIIGTECVSAEAQRWLAELHKNEPEDEES